MDNQLQEQATPAAPVQGTPLVSVLVPVYKPKEEHLRQAIESVLAQTYKNFELLLLDDCPAEPSERIIKSYNDPRIHYTINKQNCGISKARNILLDMAKGDYVAILDHDDICMPTRFEKQVAYLLEHPEIGVVSSWVRYVPRNQVWKIPVEDEDIRMALMSACVVPHTAAMVRREVFTQTGIRYEEEFTPAEDYRLWLRLIAHTKFHNIPESLMDYRRHRTNASRLQDEKMLRSHWRLIAYASETYPTLYYRYRELAYQITRIRFLGIPVLRKVTYRDTTTIYLFNVLPIFQWRKKFYIK